MTNERRLQKRFHGLEEMSKALEEELKKLRSKIFNERGVMDRSMRSQRLCPACGTRKLLHARRVLDRADGPTRQKMAVAQPNILWKASGAGQFESWICTACGLVEWYVKNLDEVPLDGTKRKIVVGEEPPSTKTQPERPQEIQASDARQRRAARLSEKIRLLDEELQELRDVISAGVGLEPASMRDRHQCPACGELKIIHTREILDRSEIGRDRMTLTQPHIFDLRGVGVFHAWLCTSCGLAQWSIPDLSKVKPDGKKLRVIDGDLGNSYGPYR